MYENIVNAEQYFSFRLKLIKIDLLDEKHWLTMVG